LGSHSVRDRITLMGCPIDALTMRETITRCDELIRSGGPSQQVSINAAKIVALGADERLRDIVVNCDLINADGQSIVWASRLLGCPLPARVAGIDLMYELLALAQTNAYRVYVLGARPEVLERAVDRLHSIYPGLNLCGWHHGYFADEQSLSVVDSIAHANPDILFVAMSSPHKEYWLSEHGARLRVPLVLGVGGSIDIVAGVTRRAPRWMQRAGLEWFYRFAQEPRRLAKRYCVTNAKFLAMLATELLRKQGRWFKRTP
jgi:N-acetylglucosaminyldiphosphoundecaprenol N-acetyl-beta-D-mannosaminyltransferase